jgi:hypothetical protein
MMGTEAFYYPIRANNERFLDSVNTNRVVEHGEYTDIINTAVFYKVNIIIYYAKEDRTKAGSGYILGQNLKMR